MKSIEVQLNEALELVKSRDAEIVTLKESINVGKQATAKAERDGQLKESKLPEPCVLRLSEAFAKSTDNAGLKEAINVESAYVQSLTTIKKNNGATDNTQTVNESEQQIDGFKKRQFDVYRKSGMSIEEASAASGYTPKK